MVMLWATADIPPHVNVTELYIWPSTFHTPRPHVHSVTDCNNISPKDRVARIGVLTSSRGLSVSWMHWPASLYLKIFRSEFYVQKQATLIFQRQSLVGPLEFWGILFAGKRRQYHFLSNGLRARTRTCASGKSSYTNIVEWSVWYSVLRSYPFQICHTDAIHPVVVRSEGICRRYISDATSIADNWGLTKRWQGIYVELPWKLASHAVWA